jgi:D-inositol-3-phosphate glycosyltransferase
LSEKKIILYVGRIERLKGLDILLTAISLLEERSDVRLLVVGGSPVRDRELDRLKSGAARLGIADMVTFTGSVPQSELPTYYSAADVFVLPSHYESFGLAALEAMACGIPIVVSRVGGLKTFVRDGETGYLIPWRCPEPFAQRLDMLLANPGLREAMGKVARAKALSMGWGEVADRLQEYYYCLMGDTWESVAGA